MNDQLWSRLVDNPIAVIFIAPPLDTIPSPSGNAIYVLVESLAAYLGGPTVVLARWPEFGLPKHCAISDRVLYDTKPLRPTKLESFAPYRLKKWFFGIGSPYYLQYARRAAQVCRLLRCTTVIIEDMHMFAPVVRRITGPHARILLHQHTDAPKSVPKRLWRKVIASLDGVIFVAEYTRSLTEHIHGALPIPSWIVYNGVDPQQFNAQRSRAEALNIRLALGIAPLTKVALVVGRIVPLKGIAEAAEAFLLSGVRGWHLVVVGGLELGVFSDPAYTQRLRDAADRSNGTIHLVGSKPPAAMPAYYAVASIIIVPSLGSEGLPKVVTEALAMERPCLVTNRGGVMELVQPNKNGWLVPEPVTVMSLANAIAHGTKQSGILPTATAPVDITLSGMVARFERIVEVTIRGTSHPS